MTKEVDPNGIGQHEAGAKLDHGKVDMSLVFQGFPRALLAVGGVATFGANKYTRDGWKSVPNGEIRYNAAKGRHIFKRQIEGEYDKESELLHLAHEAWNVLAELELFIKRQEETKASA